jgi:hypothetical protein
LCGVAEGGRRGGLSEAEMTDSSLLLIFIRKSVKLNLEIKGGDVLFFWGFEQFVFFCVKRRLLGQAKEILSNLMMLEI